jgi:FkbM family methyltransferase
MTVFDVGGHNGFYSLLAWRLVGVNGTVVAFEPSPRERRRLRINLRLNRARVRIEPLAVGDRAGTTELFVVRGRETGFNSLRAPGGQRSKRVLVPVTTLDDYVHDGNRHVDVLKIDVEGGERNVLMGAEHLLTSSGRPVILCEVDDRRTLTWGYPASEVVAMLTAWRYVVLRILDDRVVRIDRLDPSDSGGNMLAVPDERWADVADLLTGFIEAHA